MRLHVYVRSAPRLVAQMTLRNACGVQVEARTRVGRRAGVGGSERQDRLLAVVQDICNSNAMRL